MVWKRVENADGGDADHFGGNDIDKISNLFSGGSNIDVVDMNSQWTFRDGMLYIRNPANTRSYRIRASAILNDYELSLPLLTSNDQLVARVAAMELEGKTIDSTKNTLLGTLGMPDSMKTGLIQAGNMSGGNVGQGLFNGFVDLPAIPVRNIEGYPGGGFWRYNTGGTADVFAGIRMQQTMTRKEFDPRFKTRIRVPATTGHSSTALYVGLNTDVVMEPDNEPLSTTESGVMVGWRNEDSNFMVFRNSGTNAASATASVVNTGLARTTAIRAIEIKFINQGASVVVTLYDSSVIPETVLYTQTFTSNLPASGFSMAPSIIMRNTAAVSRDFDIYHAFIQQRV